MSISSQLLPALTGDLARGSRPRLLALAAPATVPAPVAVLSPPKLHRSVDRQIDVLAAQVESHLRFAAWTEAHPSSDQQLACDARAQAAALSRRAFDLAGRDLSVCYFCDDAGRTTLGSEKVLCGICNGTKRLPISTQMPLFCTLCNGTCRFS